MTVKPKNAWHFESSAGVAARSLSVRARLEVMENEARVAQLESSSNSAFASLRSAVSKPRWTSRGCRRASRAPRYVCPSCRANAQPGASTRLPGDDRAPRRIAEGLVVFASILRKTFASRYEKCSKMPLTKPNLRARRLLISAI